MPDSDPTELAVVVDRAVGTIARLRAERHELRQQVGTLESRIGNLEDRRRADHDRLERLARLETERAAVKSRLGKLLTQLEPTVDDS